MRIGLDFDNTIACYDGVFHAAALERGLIPGDLPTSKVSVRDFLNGSGNPDAFTGLQGYIYGSRMDLAALYEGVADFMRQARVMDHELFIVSHKTRYPMLGPKYDLHAAARAFLVSQGFIAPGEFGIPSENLFFELTKAEKLGRIGTLACDLFVDDLPDLLADPAFPAATRGILFDPDANFAGSAPPAAYRHWNALTEALKNGTL